MSLEVLMQFNLHVGFLNFLVELYKEFTRKKWQ